MSNDVSHRAVEAPSQSGSSKENCWYPGLCKMCMQGDCVMRVHVIDGVVVEVEGDDRAPNNMGTLCPRGNASIMHIYNPYRVKAPLKRTNPKKGLNEDPGWVEISWEEALSIVGERLKSLHEDDPRKLVLISGFGQVGAYFSNLLPFIAAYGSPNDVPSRGSACSVHFGTLVTHGQFPIATVDSNRCNYVLSFGRDFGPNHATSSTGTRAFLDMVERGTKVVSIEPRCSPMASKCYKWIPIRPGTDHAFLLGMLHTVLYEINNFDFWFVKNRTNAPYLIGKDGDYIRDQQSTKPLLWDEIKGHPMAFDEIPPMHSALEGTYEINGMQTTPAFQLIKNAMKEYTPEWAEKITTVPAETIRTISREFIEHAQIGSTVNIDGFTFPFSPVAIAYQRGAYMHTVSGVFGDITGKILMMLAGALEVPGGLTGNWTPNEEVIRPDEEGTQVMRSEAAGEPWVWPVNKVDSHTFYPLSHTRVSQLAKAILDPATYHLSYEPEILLTCGGNPIRGGFDRKIMEAAYAKVPFSFTVSLVLDEPAMIADVVLPIDSFMEYDILEPGPLFIMQPHKLSHDDTRSLRIFPWRDASSIKKVYDTRNVYEILCDLAEHVGIMYGEGGFIDTVAKVHGIKLDVSRSYTGRELADVILKTHYGNQHSIEEITDNTGPVYKYLTAPKPCKENFNYYYWPENKTRHPMYIVQLLRKGNELRQNLRNVGLKTIPGWKEEDMGYFWKAFQPIPVWVPGPQLDAPKEYDMWAINWKTAGFPFNVGDACGNPWLNDVMKTFDPYEFAILLNAKTALKKGLTDGDTIIVESRYGKTKGNLKTTQLIHPEVVGIPSCHGARSIMANPITGEGPYFNPLCSIHEEDRAVDPITAGIDLSPAVKIYKA